MHENLSPPSRLYVAAMRYYKSYLPTEKEAIKKAFKEEGFVVVDNVVTEEDVMHSIDEIWAYIENKGFSMEILWGCETQQVLR